MLMITVTGRDIIKNPAAQCGVGTQYVNAYTSKE